MLALGFGLEKDALTQRMRLGAHLLAPTGADLDKHGKIGTVFAGYHYDLNFLTIHGKSRYPGLNIWLRNGKKLAVRIPDGCLLLQAGKQLEWLTGGDVQTGYHEVSKENISNGSLDVFCNRSRFQTFSGRNLRSNLNFIVGILSGGMHSRNIRCS